MLAVFFTTISIAQTAEPSSDKDSIKESVLAPKIEFETDSFFIGNIPNDTIVTRVFKFKNAGTYDLYVIDVSADCSCTVPEYTAGTFAPGEEGSVTVNYNSKDSMGRFLQYITVFHDGNQNGYTFLTIEGFVELKL